MVSIDVEIYSHVKGKKLNHFIALEPGPQAAVKAAAEAMGTKLRLDHARHRRDGHSFVFIDHGRPDSFFGIDDQRGDGAAGAILARVTGMKHGKSPRIDAKFLSVAKRAVRKSDEKTGRL